jgi:hypothetical protein
MKKIVGFTRAGSPLVCGLLKQEGYAGIYNFRKMAV